MTSLEELWPPFALRAVAGPIDLRMIRDEDIPELVDLALAGIHDPAVMPFSTPWTDASPDDLPAATAAYHWNTRATFSPQSWSLDLVVRYRGAIVGVQGFSTRNYLVTRTGETGSWLGGAHQGQGIGTLMRQAMCALLFDHLDACEITSAAYVDNPASLGVSRKVGFVANGTFREQRREGEVAVSHKLLLTRDAFVRGPHPLHAEGVEPLRRFIGLE